MKRHYLQVLREVVEAEKATRDAALWLGNAQPDDLERARKHYERCAQNELSRKWVLQKLDPEGATYGLH
jgi:hypothetical protein